MMTIPPQQAAPRHEPPLGEERILMKDYAPIQARGKGEAPTASREGGQEAAKALNASPLLSADGVEKDVPSAGRDSRHHCRTTSGVRTLVLFRLHT
jgi:hypothetical protein